MSVIVKICGLKSEDVLEAALDAGADMVGFAHFPKSPRHLELDRIAELIAATGGRAETCLFLVDPDDALVRSAAATGTDWLQLHGSETPERVAAVKAASGRRVMKVLPVAEKEDLAAFVAYRGIADRIMFDAKPPGGADRPGGLGKPFDWSILSAIDPGLEFMLAGGLTPENVAEAVTRIGPLAVDVSSGVESAPGEKDADKIRAFIAAARVADEARNEARQA